MAYFCIPSFFADKEDKKCLEMIFNSSFQPIQASTVVRVQAHSASARAECSSHRADRPMERKNRAIMEDRKGIRIMEVGN